MSIENKTCLVCDAPVSGEVARAHGRCDAHLLTDAWGERSARRPLIITIPGVRILSSKLSKNARGHWGGASREAREHRHGANVQTAKGIANMVPGYVVEHWHRPKPPTPVLVARIYGAGRCEWYDHVYPARKVTLHRWVPNERWMADSDNLSTLFKPVRDGVADALGIDDKDKTIGGRVAWAYSQERDPWGIRITIETL